MKKTIILSSLLIILFAFFSNLNVAQNIKNSSLPPTVAVYVHSNGNCGAPIYQVGANITLIDETSGQTYYGTTGSTGHYDFSIFPGHNIVASATYGNDYGCTPHSYNQDDNGIEIHFCLDNLKCRW